MSSGFEQIMRQAGPPVIANLYLRDCWRYAVYHVHGAVMDGYLALPPTATLQAARAELEDKLRVTCERIYNSLPTIEWESELLDANGMVTGTVQANPLRSGGAMDGLNAGPG